MTLIETLIAVSILATAMIGMAEFMAKFAHVTRMSAVQQGPSTSRRNGSTR